MIKLPYGIRDFYALNTQNYLYIDRTHHIPLIEDWGQELFFLRPRRFGKSLWLSTLANYYDVATTDDFGQLFGHLTIGQNPTPLHNQFLIMKWDFSEIAAHGSIDRVEKRLHEHMNEWIAIFSDKYQDVLTTTIRINSANALASFHSAVAATKLSPYKLYLLIDEYDNFANEIMMGQQGDNHQRYMDLVKSEGIFKTLFKNIKSAGSGNGLDKVFMTGVSPVVLNDVTSGANTFKNISWLAALNDLCGFNRSEVEALVQKVVAQCQLPESQVEIIMAQMHNFYNGSRFIDDYHDYEEQEFPKVYNPTLTFYFLESFQLNCRPPREIIDENLIPDDSKLRYIASYAKGETLLTEILEGSQPISVYTLRKKFGMRDLLNPNLQEDRLAVLLCHLGALTSVGETPSGKIVLDIPNLIMRQLYCERILEQMTQKDDEKIATGWAAADGLFTLGEVLPLCTFVEEHLLSIYDNRDAKSFDELTLKTLFITLLYHTNMYLIDSEPAIEQRYGDLIMMVRPGMRTRGLYDILFEFKHVPLKKMIQQTTNEAQKDQSRKLAGEEVKAMSRASLIAVDAVQKELDQAKSQLQAYRSKLSKKYGADLKLRSYAVVSIGFSRILWEEIV